MTGRPASAGSRLPGVERRGGEQIVVADHRVDVVLRRQASVASRAHTRHGVDAQLLEVPSEMLAQKWMPGNTQHAHVAIYAATPPLFKGEFTRHAVTTVTSVTRRRATRPRVAASTRSSAS